MRFFKLSHILMFLIKKTLKIDIQENNLHNSMTPSRPEIFFQKPTNHQIGMPKKNDA